jgi:hypothetical protein
MIQSWNCNKMAVIDCVKFSDGWEGDLTAGVLGSAKRKELREFCIDVKNLLRIVFNFFYSPLSTLST